MPAGPCRILLAVCAIIATALPAFGQKPTFAELLARAQTQAAAGHKWTPAGDNMTETVVDMMDLIPTATAEQLAQLSELLEIDKARPPRQAREPAIGEQTTKATPAPDPFADTARTPPDMATATAVPVRPVPPAPDTTATVPVRPAPNAAAQIAPRPGPRAMDLFARGQQAELRGDVSGARRFYSSAAQQGHAIAARDLGRLYDPGYLKLTALGGIAPDPAMARRCYEQAIAMGDAEAGPLLEALSLR
jgi:hypothetical protein